MRNGCAFCDYAGPSPILHRFERVVTDVIVFEPMGPVTDGHLVVVPTVHVAGFEDPGVARDVFDVVSLLAGSTGHWNVIASVGEAATQTIPHLHVHLVPRERGDGLLLPWGKPSHAHRPKPQPGTPEYEAWLAARPTR
jgi:histidine triad (HIT) family protein